MTEVKLTDKEYRRLDRLSFSAVKMFDENRLKFYKKYVVNDKSVEEEENTAMLLGSVTDCLKFSPKEFDDRFVVATCNAPSGQMGDFVSKLCQVTLKCLDKDFVVTRPMTELMEEAFMAVKFDKSGKEVAFKKKDFAWLVANFVGTEAEIFYKTCRANYGKSVVDTQLIDAAHKTMYELENSPFEKVRYYWNVKESEGIEVHDQLPLLYDIKETPFKGMPDRVVVFHDRKTIEPVDLKISYTGEDFGGYNYWKMKYYLQNASYYLGLMDWRKKMGWDDYQVSGIKFLVGSSTLQSNPLLFETDANNIAEGLVGYTTKGGIRKKGLYELVEEINWHTETMQWRNSKEVYDKQGVIKITPFEEQD